MWSPGWPPKKRRYEAGRSHGSRWRVTPYNPDDWIDILGLFLMVVGVVGAAGAPAWITTRRHKAMSADLAVVKDQVKNNHTSNLRCDLDDIADQLRGLRSDVGQLRGELREERHDRIAADDQINQHIKLEITRPE